MNVSAAKETETIRCSWLNREGRVGEDMLECEVDCLEFFVKTDTELR